MALSTSPRKVVPLSSGVDSHPRPKLLSGSLVTKRAFFCGVVVEGPSDGKGLSEDVQDLVASLGDTISLSYKTSNSSETDLPSLRESGSQEAVSIPRKRALTDTSALADLIDELVTTERSYVKRLRMLKDSYADPLRSYARSRDTAIIPAYEAKILFGNVDNLVPVNEAFLRDLETMQSPEGPSKVGGIGDIALHHFKNLHAFDCYKQYYVKREEAQVIFKKEMTKKSSTGFAAFVERIKYSTADSKNRIGLRELLMEPIQRVPRYTLLFRTMIKRMHPGDPQRVKLIEAEEVASKIALAETDDQTMRAAVMYALSASIDGFPPGLISSSRRFIDCIDVEDNGGEAGPGSSSSSSINTASSSANLGPTLHCTLFLFDDKLMIVKRPNGEKSGRTLAGLDNLEKFTNGAGFPKGTKKSGMSFKGMVDVTDVVATDVTGADMHIYLETPPQDQSDRWFGRPFRILSVVTPPSPVYHNPIKTEADKKRFLENLWTAQAKYRTRAGQSVVLCADDRQVESTAGQITLARTYFNIYQRTSFLKEPKKTKIVVHIDSLGCADPIPFGMHASPYVLVRVQPMAGELSRYTVASSDPDDEPEEDIVQTARVPARIIHTIHQFGLFKFKTNAASSRPTTPTASARSRAHIFGLDAISRNLFNARPGLSSGSSRGVSDVFGPVSSTMSAHQRAKSANSKASTSGWTETNTSVTTATSDSLMKFSQRSVSTAATSLMGLDEDSFIGRSVSKSKKLIKRGRSQASPSRFDSGSESERGSPLRARTRSRSKEVSRERDSIEYSDGEDISGVDIPDYNGILRMNQSELDLSRRLELARRNSKSQHGQPYVPTVLDRPVEETIYEEEPPPPTRPVSRAANSYTDNDTTSLTSTILARPRSTTPTPGTGSPRKGRSVSRASSERRPLGPRAPSPLPPTVSALPSLDISGLPSMDIELALERTLVNMGHTLTPQTPASRRKAVPHPEEERDVRAVSPLTKSKRQPFESMGNITEFVSTPKVMRHGTGTSSITSVEPLSIKKKVSTKSPPSTRRKYGRNSLARGTSPKVQRKEPPPHVNGGDENAGISYVSSLAHTASKSDIPEKLLRLCVTTKEDLESSKRAIKRIKLEVNSLASKAIVPQDSEIDEQGLRSPGRPTPRTPQRSIPAPTKEAQQRFEEMRQLIAQRTTDVATPATPRSRPRSMAAVGKVDQQKSGGGDSPDLSKWTKNVSDVLGSMERDVMKVDENQQLMRTGLESLAKEFNESSMDLDKTRTELRSIKRQCELVKNLLADATAENEIMYEAFNEELDGMFNDANLPEDEAWTAMTNDLRQTKEAKNVLTRENGQLKRRLQEVEMQRDEWAALLRAHGLIS